jgi:hypothetical protein
MGKYRSKQRQQSQRSTPQVSGATALVKDGELRKENTKTNAVDGERVDATEAAIRPSARFAVRQRPPRRAATYGRRATHPSVFAPVSLDDATLRRQVSLSWRRSPHHPRCLSSTAAINSLDLNLILQCLALTCNWSGRQFL